MIPGAETAAAFPLLILYQIGLLILRFGAYKQPVILYTFYG